MKENPALFQASPLVRDQLSQIDKWTKSFDKKANVVLNSFAIVGLFIVVCSTVTILVQRGESEQLVLGFKLATLVTYVLIGLVLFGILTLVFVRWYMSKVEPSTIDSDQHIARLKRLGELTDTPWETFIDKPRFYERVVKPKLAAYYAGTVQLIQDHHGVESHEWYDKYRELYILARTLRMHPIGTPYDPVSYEWIDDHTQSSNAIFEG